jgi:hypothetical protein
MSGSERPIAFWGICVFLTISLVMLLLGQTTAIFTYDFAVSLGLQESVEEVSEFGVEVNRAFGVGDTVVYVPLILFALMGLIKKRRWALPVTGAVMGISAYWAMTVSSMFVFLPGAPGYSLMPGPEYWIVLSVFFGVGIWGVIYVSVRGDRLVGDI